MVARRAMVSCGAWRNHGARQVRGCVWRVGRVAWAWVPRRLDAAQCGAPGARVLVGVAQGMFPAAWVCACAWAQAVCLGALGVPWPAPSAGGCSLVVRIPHCDC